MKKTNFLSMLHKKGKLKLVDSSEEVKFSYIVKSETNLASSKLLFDNNLLEEAVSLAYFSMYNLLLALFFKVGIKCEDHTGSILLMKTLFNLDNTPILLAKKERIDKQYYVDFNITKEQVLESIILAERENKKLFDFLSKMKNSDIQDYRGRFKEIIK